MSRIARIAVLATAIALLGLTAGASSAFATNVVVCQVNGAEGQMTPGPKNVLTDLEEDLYLLDTDSGTYWFNSNSGPFPLPTLCADVNPTGVSVASVTLDSKGYYTDSICSTGTERSPTGQTTFYDIALLAQSPSTAQLSLPGGFSYDITFAAGSGLLTGAYTSNGGGTVFGYINIAPDVLENGGNCVDHDVWRYVVTGAFTAVGG